MRGCNRKHFARRLAEGRRACNRVERRACNRSAGTCSSWLSPTSAGSRSTCWKNPGSTWARSRCQRAGQDISKAIRLADKHPRR